MGEKTRLRLLSNILILIAAFAFSGCRPYYVSSSLSARLETSGATFPDSSILAMVEPYRSEMESSMNVVIAELESDLTKEQPECSLGNHVAQITFESAAASLGRPVDFSVMNYGGLRVPSLSSGPLRVSDAYQIMPFDNFIVVMELDGAAVQQLMDILAAYGGWPVHRMSFVIDGDKATDVRIGGEEIVPDKVYSMALTDYLADGGDNLDMLRQYKYSNTGILLRDAIMASWRATASEGRKVQAARDGRVSIR